MSGFGGTSPAAGAHQAPFWLDVARGFVPGVAIVHKFGKNPDIDNAATFEAVWNGGGPYTGFNATAAEVVEVFSSSAADAAAGTGAHTVELFGLDANYNEIGETVTLNGLTAVSTVNAYLRLHRLIVRSAGSGGSNAGTLTARQSVTVANVYAVMPIGYNQTMIAAYTVPAGKTGYLTSWTVAIAGRTAADVEGRLVIRPFGEVFQVKEELALRNAASSIAQRVFHIPKDSLSEKSDIFIEASSDANNTAVSAAFDCVLVDN